MNQKVPKNITTIVFDLGGVLFDIDYSLTQQAFIALGAANFDKQYSQQVQNGVFDDFEKGNITPVQFRKEVLKWLPAGITDKQVDDAWNALLLGFPDEKINLLKRLKNKYRLFLLSNTNEIHLPAVITMIDGLHGQGIMGNLFEKEYYSCKMGMRKPDAEIFEYVTNENSLIPSSTLFIDDSIQNIKGADSVSMQTLHCTPSVSLAEYFSVTA
jgi:FMN phosphatase YigB (HAD superfamily)